MFQQEERSATQIEEKSTHTMNLLDFEQMKTEIKHMFEDSLYQQDGPSRVMAPFHDRESYRRHLNFKSVMDRRDEDD